MKVKELIKALQKENPENIAVRSGCEGGVSEIREVGPVKIKLNVNEAWYYGEHEKDEDGDTNATYID